MEITGIRNFSFPRKVTLEQVSSEFEAIFLSHIFKGFKQMIPKSTGEGFGNTILEPILEMQLSSFLCKSCNFGIRDYILENQQFPKTTQKPFQQTSGIILHRKATSLKLKQFKAKEFYNRTDKYSK